MQVRFLPVAPISNFPIFARPIRPREARKGMETLARPARGGRPRAGRKPLRFLIFASPNKIMNMEQHKFFLYARKSTDVEDKQIRSIEDQIAELRAFAKQEKLNVIDVLIEKQSAKIPGRPIFNEMLDKVERGEANGILAWHADRLARNSVDGGRIIYLLDTEKLASLKFPTLWFENTPQGKFMLNIVFGQSKYYVDSLSEN